MSSTTGSEHPQSDASADILSGPTDFAGGLWRLGTNSLVYGLSSTLARCLGFLLQPYYAHYFTPAQNGVLNVFYAYVPIISIPIYLGMDAAYMRSAASVRIAPLPERQRAFSAAFGAVLAIGGALTGLALVGTPVLAPLARLDARSFRFMLAIVFTDALLAVPFAHLRMANRSWRYATLRLLFVGLTIALNVLLIGHLGWGVEAVFLVNIAANLAVLALCLSEINRLFRPRLLRGAAWRPLWAYALPMMPATLAVMIVENGDRLVLNALPARVAHAVYGMTAQEVVGIYAFNYKLGMVMMLVVEMFRLAWTPFFLQHALEPRAPQLFSRVLTALALLCTGVLLSVSFLLPPLARFQAVAGYVRPAYWAGLPIVPVILLGYLFSGTYDVVTAGIHVERRTAMLAWVAGAGAALNLGICILAGWHWGMVGVAWATPAAYALMTVLGARESQRVFPVPFEWERLFHIGAVAAVLFAVNWWIEVRGAGHLPAPGLSFKFLLLLGFPLLLWATGFFREHEWAALRWVDRQRGASPGATPSERSARTVR
jgi:O-antigen/teichoic acid export membrane protein